MNSISTSNPTNHLDDILAAQRAAFLREGHAKPNQTAR